MLTVWPGTEDLDDTSGRGVIPETFAHQRAQPLVGRVAVQTFRPEHQHLKARDLKGGRHNPDTGMVACQTFRHHGHQVSAGQDMQQRQEVGYRQHDVALQADRSQCPVGGALKAFPFG